MYLNISLTFYYPRIVSLLYISKLVALPLSYRVDVYVEFMYLRKICVIEEMCYYYFIIASFDFIESWEEHFVLQSFKTIF